MKFATLLTPSSKNMSRTPFSNIPQWEGGSDGDFLRRDITIPNFYCEGK